MKIIKLAYTALALCLLSSCSLDEKSYTEIEKNKYMNNATEAQTVLNGIYRDLCSDSMYGYYLSLYFTIPTDLAKVEGSQITNFRNVPSNSYTSTESSVQDAWASLYSAIYDANDFLERLSGKIDNFSDADKPLAAIYLAEARALRALFYFELLRWYGHVALMKDTEQSKQHPSTFSQAEPEEVFRFIEADLKYAVSVLPYATEDNVRPDNKFRFSKGGALGLLAKVYATWAGFPVHDTSKWAECAAAARSLVESGKHGLLDDYEQLWVNSSNSVWDPKESLIEVSFYSPSITGDKTFDSSGRMGKWNGVIAANGALPSGRVAGNWRVVPTFAANWKDYARDKRWAVSIADYQYRAKEGKQSVITYMDGAVKKEGNLEMAVADGASSALRQQCNNNLTPRKWDIATYAKEENQITDADRSNTNWYILRYADVLLLYAEALNEVNQGPTSAAYKALNMVRRRGFGLPAASPSTLCDIEEGLDYQSFSKALRDERAYELAFEGQRRQDLTRWGIYYETIHNTYLGLADWHEAAPDYYVCGQYTIEGKNELLPIPQRDMDMMPKFKQNKGWE